MKNQLLLLLGLVLQAAVYPLSGASTSKPVTIADGKTFRGWEGDTNTIWRIENGAFVGGSLKEKVPHNEFLCTKRSYTNFVLRLKFKLVGTDGFINGGVQVRSQHITNPPYELSGYQADMGDPAWWGCLYDESRRNKVLEPAQPGALKNLHKEDWNQYVIDAKGDDIRL